MEATAGTPGTTGTHPGTGSAGEHVHQLISLAAALTTATTASTTAGPGNDADTDTDLIGGAAGGVGGGVSAPLGVRLGSLTDAQAVAWAKDLESLSRVLAALQVQAAGELGERTGQGRFDPAGTTSATELLSTMLRVSGAEANRRLRLAERFLPVTNPLTLVTTAPVQPVLGTAFFTGTLSSEEAHTASSYVDDASHLVKAGRIPAGDAQSLEETLTRYAQQEPPDFLRRVGNRALALLDPDGQEPTEGELTAKQGIFFRHPRRGMVHYDGYLTIAQYESLMAAIGWATNPAPHKNINTTNTGSEHNNDSDRAGSQSSSSQDANSGTTGRGDGRGGDDDGLSSTITDTGGSGILPGQTDLLDILHTTATMTPPTTPQAPRPAPATSPAPSSTKTTPTPDQTTRNTGSVPEESWPPPQGPPPDWAQATTHTHTHTHTHNSNNGNVNGGNSCDSGNNSGGGGSADGGAPVGGCTDQTDWIFPPTTATGGTGWDQPPPTNNTGGTGGTGTDTSTTTSSTDTSSIGGDSGGGDCDDDMAGNNTANTTDGESTAGPEFWATPGVDHDTGNDPPSERTEATEPGTTDPETSCPGTTGSGAGTGQTQHWPHLIQGINVPEPGSDNELPGLNPIDPNCTDPAVQDTRTRPQRLLDALIDCLKLAARTGQLPTNNAMKPQLIISTTEKDLQASRNQGKSGIAFLPYTGPSSLNLFDTELCDAEITTMILGNGQEILNTGRTQRLFTNAQRKRLIARDLGCTFPHCTRNAGTCEAHHIKPWQDGGETNLNNACLLCEHHHHLIHQGTWTIHLKNGVPYYTPTYKLDPQQQPRRNTYHHALTTNDQN